MFFANFYTDIVPFLSNLYCPRKYLDVPSQNVFKIGLWKKNYVQVEYWTK